MSQMDNAIRAQAAGHRNDMLSKYRDKVEELFRLDQLGPATAIERGIFTREEIAGIAQDSFTLLIYTMGCDALDQAEIPDGIGGDEYTGEEHEGQIDIPE